VTKKKTEFNHFEHVASRAHVKGRESPFLRGKSVRRSSVLRPEKTEVVIKKKGSGDEKLSLGQDMQSRIRQEGMSYQAYL